MAIFAISSAGFPVIKPLVRLGRKAHNFESKAATYNEN